MVKYLVAPDIAQKDLDAAALSFDLITLSEPSSTLLRGIRGEARATVRLSTKAMVTGMPKIDATVSSFLMEVRFKGQRIGEVKLGLISGPGLLILILLLLGLL